MTKKNIALMEFESNPNIGLYMFVNDKFCILGKDVNSSKKAEIEKILGVPVYFAKVLGTELVGVFISGNNNFILIPEILENEFSIFKEIADKHNIDLIKISDKFNTLGNNICISENKIIINAQYSKELISFLQKKTNINTIISINKKEFNGIGAMCRYVNGMFFVSEEFEEKDLKKFISEIAGNGTVNSGSCYISSGLVGNNKGIILGSLCSTIEIQNITESLNYI